MISGLKFPLSINNGRLEHITSSKKFTQNISRIVNTTLLEREMEPDMGSDSFSMLFRTNNISVISTILLRLKEQINKQEPRITVKDIQVENTNNGNLLLNVFYIINNTEELVLDQVEVS